MIKKSNEKITLKNTNTRKKQKDQVIMSLPNKNTNGKSTKSTQQSRKDVIKEVKNTKEKNQQTNINKIKSAGLYSQVKLTSNHNDGEKTSSNTKATTTRKRRNTKNSASSTTSDKKRKSVQNRKKSNKPSMKVTFLGGLNEIGKNMTMFECGKDAFILDCGLAFPEEEMMGVDIVIPDFSYVERNKDKIRGIAITHGHEDHIGGIPYLFKKVTFPVYGTALSMGLIESKLKEHRIQSKSLLNVRKAGDRVKFGCMEVEFIHVNHSIPDAVGIAIHSPAGTIVHTGDFKIDFTPAKDKAMDLTRFAELGKEGVLALFSDSTNSENEGFTPTERKVEETIQDLFNKAEGKRIIVASFASNINRIQQIIQCANKVGRKVAFSGRSMLNYMETAERLGYLDIPKDVIIDLNSINKYGKDEIVLVTTGSQGEPMAALSRMANSDHRTITVGEGDFIILSSRPIPGNEKMVGNVVNSLLKKGCEVVYESKIDVHVSGHACSGEQKLILSLVHPKYLIPVHGEQKHLRKHKETAISMGMKEENIFIEDIGKALEINENYAKNLPDVPAGKIMVDGSGIGDVGSVVLRDRKALGENGLIITVVTIEKKTGKILAGPDVVSRGFVYVKESEPLMLEAKKKANKVIQNCQENNIKDWATIKSNMRDELSKLIYNRTKRNPIILPIIMEV